MPKALCHARIASLTLAKSLCHAERTMVLHCAASLFSKEAPALCTQRCAQCCAQRAAQSAQHAQRKAHNEHAQ